MKAKGGQDPRDIQWRLMMRRGQPLDVLAEVSVMLQDADPSARASLLRWQAEVQIQLGEYGHAMESAHHALEAVTDATDPKVTALIHATIGAACAATGRRDEAVANFLIAERLLREQGEEWALGAVFTNHAICELSRNAINKCLALLESASACMPQSENDRNEQPERLATIRINRSIGFVLSGRTREAVDELLEARKEILPTGNALLLGIVDFNLSDAYRISGLYGSMLEAAESAIRMYSAAGSQPFVRKAKGRAAAAFAYLGKWQQAQEIVDYLLSSASSDEMEQVHADLAFAARAFRRQGWGEIPGSPIGKFGKRSGKVPLILERLTQLRAQSYVGDAYTESEDLIARLAAIDDHPGARLLAEFERALRNAVLEPDNSEPLDPKFLLQLDATFGAGSSREAAALLRGVAGRSAGSINRQMNAFLEVLWNTLETWYDQHGEMYRSDFLSGLENRALTDTMNLAVEANRPDVIMEVIETFRIDTSTDGSPRTKLGLAPFVQIADFTFDSMQPARDGLDLLRPARYLGDPRPVAVRGRSAIAEAASLTQQPVELDRLRVKLAADDAFWWSFSIIDETLYWAVLSPDSIDGGKRELPSAFVTAVKAHLWTLPVTLESDLILLGSMRDSAAARLIALARAASTAMLDRPLIRDAALAALPADLRRQARDYCAEAGQGDVRDTYTILSEILLPEVLRHALLTADYPCRLIVTLPPELATVPVGMLPIETDSVVLEHASVQFSPPAGLAERLSLLPHNQIPRPHLLAIADTAGDLAWAARRPSSSTPILTGWSAARDFSEVATRQQVEQQLRHGSWQSGSPGVLSYTGHLVPGDRDHPGSAALICAQAEAGGLPDLLTASEILSWREARFPSHVYLGGCEGTGFGTGLEWASLAAAALARGASCILSHAWPIVDSSDTATVDETCMRVLSSAGDVAETLAAVQRSWFRQWKCGEPAAFPPHFWAGLQLIGCTSPMPKG